MIRFQTYIRLKEKFVDMIKVPFGRDLDEIYKDPNPKEFKEIVAASHQSSANGILRALVGSRDIYVWPGSVFHSDVMNTVGASESKYTEIYLHVAPNGTKARMVELSVSSRKKTRTKEGEFKLLTEMLNHPWLKKYVDKATKYKAGWHSDNRDEYTIDDLKWWLDRQSDKSDLGNAKRLADLMAAAHTARYQF